MSQRISPKVMKELENKINEKIKNASIVEYDDEPLNQNENMLCYGYSLDLEASVEAKVDVQGAQLDVDQFEEDTPYYVECVAKGTTRNSESALILINAETGEITVKQIKSAPFTEIAEFDIINTNGLDDVNFYEEELQEQSNWNKDYLEELTLDQFSFHVEPSILFID